MIVIKSDDTDITTKLVYSSSRSRPSKSLLTPELYSKKDLDTPFNIYENLIEHQLTEMLAYFNRGSKEPIDKFTTDTRFSEILRLINENKESVFYKLDNLHSFVNVEFVVLTSRVFKKSVIYFSKFDYSVFIFCKGRLDKSISTVINDKNYVKSFGIMVPDELQDQIKVINDNVFTNEYNIKSYFIDNLTLNKRDSILKDIKLVTNYYLSYIKKVDITNNSCNCENIFKSEILNCRVCEKCYALYSDGSFLSDLDLVLG